MIKRRTFLFICRDVYWVYSRRSIIGYGFYTGDGVDVAVVRSVKDGLKLITKVDKTFNLGSVQYRRVHTINNGDFKHFTKAVQCGDVVKVTL